MSVATRRVLADIPLLNAGDVSQGYTTLSGGGALGGSTFIATDPTPFPMAGRFPVMIGLRGTNGTWSNTERRLASFTSGSTFTVDAPFSAAHAAGERITLDVNADFLMHNPGVRTDTGDLQVLGSDGDMKRWAAPSVDGDYVPSWAMGIPSWTNSPAFAGTVRAGGAAYASVTTDLGTANSNLLFTSRYVGTQANTLTIAYVDPGAGDHAFSIAVNIPSVGVGAITVSLATTSGVVTTTAQDVIDAFTAADTFPSLLPVNVVAVASGGNATGVVGAGSWTLTGGVDGTALTSSGVDISGPGTVIGPLGIPINVHFVNPSGPAGQQVLLWGGSYDGSGIIFGEATDVGVDFVLGNPGGGYQQVIGADLTHSFLQGASALTGSGGDGAPAILRPGAQDGAGVPGTLIFDFTGGDAMVATGPLVVRLLDGDHAAITTTGFTNGILTGTDVAFNGSVMATGFVWSGTKSANRVLAAPASGSPAVPDFRALVAADIPDLSAFYLTGIPDLSAIYSVKAGNASLATVGTVTAGTWNATAIAVAKGGTGSAFFTVAGPTATRTYTFPDANATIARTDAANTFIGHQTIEGVTSTGATGTGKFVFDGSPIIVTPTIASFANSTHTHLNVAGAGMLTAAAISDIGSYALLLSPSFTTPALGAATGTSLTVTSFLKSTQSIGAVSTDGLVLTNTTAAAVGAQQWSPRVHWIGQGWKTTSTAASQQLEMLAELVPIQGAANPLNSLVFSSIVNGGTTAPLFYVQHDGSISPSTAGVWLSSSGQQGVWAGGGLYAGNSQAGRTTFATDGGSYLVSVGLRMRGDSGTIGWSNGTNPAGTIDLSLSRDGVGILAQKNGANAQESRVYGTTTGSKYLSLKHDGTNPIIDSSSGGLKLGSTAVAPAGSGTRYLVIDTNGLVTSSASVPVGT